MPQLPGSSGETHPVDNRGMDLLLPLMFFAFGAFVVKNAEQRQRIAWLGAVLGPLQLEKNMETLANGYMRALNEDDPERSDPIWRMLESTETQLARQLDQLTQDIQRLTPEQARVSRWPMALPMATRLWPNASFDLRAAVRLHADGFSTGVGQAGDLPRKQQARQLLAEMFLFQHTCHWYCRSKTVASARLLARHQTSHEQALGLVSRQTRERYLALIQA